MTGAAATNARRDAGAWLDAALPPVFDPSPGRAELSHRPPHMPASPRSPL
jgi:hypothetical protein